MEEKLTNRKKQAIETRNKIYNTALDLMDSHGFENITVEDICQKSGVAVGSFYHYFKSKNDIFFEIHKRGDEYFEKTVSPELTGDNALDLIDKYFSFYAKYNLLTGLDVVKQLYSTNNKQFIAKGRYLHRLFRGIIEKGKSNGEINNEYETSYIVDFFITAARGIVFDWCLHEGGYDLEDRIKDYIAKLILIFKL